MSDDTIEGVVVMFLSSWIFTNSWIMEGIPQFPFGGLESLMCNIFLEFQDQSIAKPRCNHIQEAR